METVLDRTLTSRCAAAEAPTPLPPDLVSAMLRAAHLGDILAETTEWMAADLRQRESRGEGPWPGAAGRIRARAAAHRADARRQRRDVELMLAG